MTMLIAITAAVSAAVLEAIGWALTAGAVTAGGIEIAKRYNKRKANKPSEEVIPYSGPSLTPAQLYKKQTLTTQEIVPKYEDVRPQSTRTVNTPVTTNITRAPVAKPVRRSSPSLSHSRPLLTSVPTPTELIGKVSPVELDHDELVLEGSKIYQLTHPNLANGVDLSTGVKPVSTDQLSIPPIDPKDDPKWKKRLKRRFTKQGRMQKSTEEFLKESTEKLSRMNEPLWKSTLRMAKRPYNIITGVSAAHQLLHNAAPFAEHIINPDTLAEATDKQFGESERSPIIVEYGYPNKEGFKLFEGEYSVPEMREILVNGSYKNMSEEDRRNLWKNIAMYLQEKPEYVNINKSHSTNNPWRGIDSLQFNIGITTPLWDNYIKIEEIDKSLDSIANDLINGIKSNNNKVSTFTVTPEDYDKIMRSDLPLWRKAVGATDYHLGNFTKTWDENFTPWGIADKFSNLFE